MENKGKLNLEEIKKIAKETNNEELAANVKKRMKNNKIVEKCL